MSIFTPNLNPTNMKKLFYALVATTALFFAGCSSDNFDPEFLSSGSGLWESSRVLGGRDYVIMERFAAGGTGKTWSPTDGMDESMAQLFRWTLEGSSLRYAHRNDMDGSYSDFETFTVLELGASKMRMRDNVSGEVIEAYKR